LTGVIILRDDEGGVAAMNRFYISDDDEDGIRCCEVSQIDGTPITITGLSEDGQVKRLPGSCSRSYTMHGVIPTGVGA
jgi:hypothetical protein